jgi:hypothetical protein
MKKILITSILVIALFVSSNCLLAQGGPPDPPGDPGSGGGPIGGAAPVGSGIGFLLALGGVYGARKVYKIYKIQVKAGVKVEKEC